MTISRRFYFQARQVIGITVAWIVLGWLDIFNSFSLLRLFQTEISPGYGPYLLFSTLCMFFSGLISGSLLVFVLRDRGRRMSFGLAIMINSAIVALINFGIAYLVLQLFNTFSEQSLAMVPGGELTSEPFFARRILLRNFFFWVIIALLTVLALHIHEKYGPGVLLKLIRGQYHRPREEERIFMFVDLKGSTTLAESLGHLRFHSLLNDYYRDITFPIIDSRGEIYQYVGDMVVITWPLELGLEQARCVRCFYRIKDRITRQADRYRERYGEVPEFKAGLHCGKVTTGEIGVIKKDIVYTGDVLNTTARIQAICNKFRVQILLSKYLLDKLNLPPGDFLPKRMGIIELKGKRQKVELYTFEESTEKQQIPRIPTPSQPAAS